MATAVSSGGSDNLRAFANDLRSLMLPAGFPSVRALAKKANYSHTVLSEAAQGKRLPTWEVTRAFVGACNGDIAEWERRWRALAMAKAQSPEPVIPTPPWPAEEVADGADPEDSGCYVDARTVIAQKVSLMFRKQIIGVVELRFCDREHAVWGRFRGSAGLDGFAAHRHRVDTKVEVVRDSDRRRESFMPEEYPFDYHWCALVLADGGLFYAAASVYFEGELVAYGETDRVTLS